MNREQMKPEKAIEILNDLWQCPHMKGMTTQNDAIKLGIEALKCLSLLNSEETGREIQNLYCKWCPRDCKGLTKDEKLGCLASGGFADELISLFPPLLNKKEE